MMTEQESSQITSSSTAGAKTIFAMAGKALILSWLPMIIPVIILGSGRLLPLVLMLTAISLGLGLIVNPKGSWITIASLYAGIQILLGISGLLAGTLLSIIFALYFMAISGFALYCLLAAKSARLTNLRIAFLGIGGFGAVLTVISIISIFVRL